MKKINFSILIFTCIACLLPIIFGIIFFNELPDMVAIHFDINNNPDNYLPREFFVFGIPVIMMMFQIFCCIISDLKDENPEANKKAVSVYKWIIPVITVVMYIVTIMYAIENKIDIRKIAMIILGVLFITVGNYIPKTIGNASFNLPKVEDEKTNKKLKKLTGYIFIINGLLFLLSIFFKPMVSVLLVVLIILEAIVLTIYSHIKDKK